ncbi:hypothetical protein MRY82_10245 [bacterium]|nr:hypothetical protein [bacterium]
MSKLNHGVAIVFAVCTAGLAFFVSGQIAAISVIFGAGLMYLNFLLLIKIGKMIFTAKQSGEQIKGGVLFVAKLLVLFGLAYALTEFVDLFWFGISLAGMILTVAFLTVKEQQSLGSGESIEKTVNKY